MGLGDWKKMVIKRGFSFYFLGILILISLFCRGWLKGAGE